MLKPIIREKITLLLPHFSLKCHYDIKGMVSEMKNVVSHNISAGNVYAGRFVKIVNKLERVGHETALSEISLDLNYDSISKSDFDFITALLFTTKNALPNALKVPNIEDEILYKYIGEIRPVLESELEGVFLFKAEIEYHDEYGNTHEVEWID